MIERVYTCNLCRAKKHSNDLHGLYWPAGATQGRWVKRDAMGCENHICSPCLFSMESIAIEYEAMRPGSRLSIDAMRGAHGDIKQPAEQAED